MSTVQSLSFLNSWGTRSLSVIATNLVPVSGNDVLLVVVVVVMVFAVAAMGYLTSRLAAVVADLDKATKRFNDEVIPAVERLEVSAKDASGQVDRLNDLITTTAAVTETVDQATQVTVRALSNPVIKGAAFAKGTKRAAKRLRGPQEV